MRSAPTLPPPETPSDRRARQLAMLHRLAELNMNAAEAAAERIAEPAPDTADANDATLALARATRAVTHVITLENRVVAGHFDRPSYRRAAHPVFRNPANADPRRKPVRDTLHEAVAAETDRTARTNLRRALDERLDEALDDDPNQKLNAGEILATVSKEFGIVLDPAKLPDHLLPIPPKPPRPRNPITGEQPPRWSEIWPPPDPDPPDIPPSG